MARARSRRTRQRLTVSGAVIALVAVVGGSAVLERRDAAHPIVTSGDTTSPPTTSATSGPTISPTATVADIREPGSSAQVAALLQSLVWPADVQPTTAPTDQHLQRPPTQIYDGPGVHRATAFWTSTESPKQLRTWLAAHPPQGLPAGGDTLGTEGQVELRSVVFNKADDAIFGPAVMVSMVRTGSQTQIRADAWATSGPSTDNPPIPPAAANTVVLVATQRGAAPVTRRLASSVAAELATLIDGLRNDPTLVNSCPDGAPTYQLIFGSHASPVAVVHCGQVTIDGTDLLFAAPSSLLTQLVLAAKS